MSQEELQEAVAASPLFHGCKRYVDSMSVKVCRKGQIVSDRQMGQEILGLVVRGSVEVYSIAMDGREIMLSQLKRGGLLWDYQSVYEHGASYGFKMRT